ncbi:MAG: hypothetical protein AAF125_10630 [Chloroflexota bacterium]
MTDLSPREPHRRLAWTDAVLDIQDLLLDEADPVYIVGGAVRDALLTRPIKDVDLTTPGDSIGIARKIANHFPNGALYIMDAERGVARAIIETMHGEMHVDVARFRSDAGDLLADLLDRDFTLNAMVVDLQGDLSLLIDPLNGERDVAASRIRRCRQGAVLSDPVRALRAVRQSSQLRFPIETETLAEVRVAGKTLRDSVSAERVRDEFFKILGLSKSVAALRVLEMLDFMDDALGMERPGDDDLRRARLIAVEKMTGLLSNLLPERRGMDLASDFGFGMALMQLNAVREQLEDHVRHRWPNDRPHYSLLNLLALMQDTDAGIEMLADAMRLSNGEKKRLVNAAMARDWVFDIETVDDLTLHRFWHQLGDSGVDVCLLTLANYLAGVTYRLEQDEWLVIVERVQVLLEAYYLRYEAVVAPDPLLDGKVLIERLGIPPGKVIGDILDAVREAQVTGEITTQEAALAFARDFASAS